MSPPVQQASAAHVLLLPLALWNLAVAQPLYSVVQKHPPFLSAHHASAADLAWVAVALSVGVPLLLGLPLLALRRWSPSVAYWCLVACCGVVGALVMAQALPPSSRLAVTIPALGAGCALAAAAYARWAGLRRLLELCAFGAILFPGLLIWQAAAGASAEAWREHVPATAARVPRPVVIVLFDEWPVTSILSGPETIDRVRFPHIADFADSSVWYPNATSVGATTALAAPAMLTGRWPEEGSRPTEDDPANLFTLLAGTVAFNVFEGPTDLCPDALCDTGGRITPGRKRFDLLADLAAVGLHRIVPEPWAGGLPPLDVAWSRFWQAGRVESEGKVRPDRALARFDDFLDGMADYPPATLHFVHVHVPHLPWTRLPTGQRYETLTVYPHGLVKQIWKGSEWEMLQAWQRHLLQVGLVDTLMARLDARLVELGLADEALVAITSDHGTSFRHGGMRRGLSQHLITDMLNVPLFVRWPQELAARAGQVGRGGSIDQRDASTLDLVPTVLDALGIDAPPGLGGHSLLAPPPPPDTRLGYRGSLDKAYRGLSYKYRTADLDRADPVERAKVWFGIGEWSRVYRLSLRPELLDRPPEPLLNHREPLEVVLRQGRRLNRFNPEATVLPVHLAGRIRGWPEERGRTDLAIAVRGTIVATSQTYWDSRFGESFTAMLDPDRLVRGDNDLQVFVIEGDGSSSSLRPTVFTGPRGRRQRARRK